MAEIDAFARKLLEESTRFLEKARGASDGEGKEAFLHAALNLGFCALEVHVNAIAEDFLTLSHLTPHERSILSEKRVDIEHGQFVLKDQLQLYRLEDRVLFLCSRFSKSRPLDRNAAYWGQFKTALKLRNSLTHARAPAVITESSVETALSAILQLLDVVYRRIYRKKYPGRHRGLQSAMTF